MLAGCQWQTDGRRLTARPVFTPRPRTRTRASGEIQEGRVSRKAAKEAIAETLRDTAGPGNHGVVPLSGVTAAI